MSTDKKPRSEALSAQGKGADHTEIYRFLAGRGRQANEVVDSQI